MNTAEGDHASNFLTRSESRSHVQTLLSLYESARIGAPIFL